MYLLMVKGLALMKASNLGILIVKCFASLFEMYMESHLVLIL